MAEGKVGIRPVIGTPPSELMLRPFQEFTRLESAGGILLIFATVAALVWANSAWSDTYFKLWETTVTIGVGELALAKPLIKWINDGLMAVFFFVVGLEIKREALVGELSQPRKTVLPIAAAMGGIAFPAVLYLAINHGTAGAAGWGVPMATDIAFALGALTLLGPRIPTGLKVYLTALAIVDDLAAVLVIALFYTAAVNTTALGVACIFLAILIVANAVGARSPIIYSLLGLGLWIAFVQSGVHATVAGVLLAMTIPVRSRIDAGEFLQRGRAILDTFEASGKHGHHVRPTIDQRAAVLALETYCQNVETPLHRMEHAMLPWVTFFILPLFAFANAGVRVDGNLGAALTHPVSLGIIVGLVLGKQVGITVMSVLAVRIGIADLPRGVTWRHIYGAAWLGGIGFTMSLFIATLAFEDPILLSVSKVGILTASLIAGAGGLLILRGVPKRTTQAVQQAVP